MLIRFGLLLVGAAVFASAAACGSSQGSAAPAFHTRRCNPAFALLNADVVPERPTAVLERG